MSRIFAAACALALLGPAAFAQNTMSNTMGSTMGNGMSSGSASTLPNGGTGMKPANAMKPLQNKAQSTMGSAMSNTMAPANNMGNGTTSP